jgi:hypothetical protein
MDYGVVRHPGVRLLEDGTALYVMWTAPQDREVDFARWEKVPLSEYYVAVEHAEAAKAGDGS